MSANYVSPFKIMSSKAWIIGFIEGEGSFYIESDGSKHKLAFNVNQKHDTFVLEYIRIILEINSNITTSDSTKK